MEALTAELAQHGLRIVFTNVLLQQIGIPIPAEPTLVVAGSLASRHVLSGSAVALCALTAIVIADLDLVRDRTLVRRSRAPSGCPPAARARITHARDRAYLRAVGLQIAGHREVPARLLAGAVTDGGGDGGSVSDGLALRPAGRVLWTGATVGGGMFFHRQIEALLAAPPGAISGWSRAPASSPPDCSPGSGGAVAPREAQPCPKQSSCPATTRPETSGSYGCQGTNISRWFATDSAIGTSPHTGAKKTPIARARPT